MEWKVKIRNLTVRPVVELDKLLRTQNKDNFAGSEFLDYKEIKTYNLG
jgi:hypothetical protein